MANLFTSGYSSFLILRRDLEEVLDEMELPWRMRREMDRLFAESTSPMSLWRNMEHLLDEIGAPFVLRRRIEHVFARFLSGRGLDNTFVGSTHSPFFGNRDYFTPSHLGQQNPYFGSGYGPQLSPFSNQFSQFSNYNPHVTPSFFNQGGFTTSYGHGGFTAPQFTGRDWVMSGRNEWLGSPRNEWLGWGRYNDTISPVRGWSRNNVFGSTFGNTFGNTIGNTFGNTMFGNTFGGSMYNQPFGNTFGNTMYNQPFGNTFGNTMYNQPFGNTFGQPYGNTWGTQSFGHHTPFAAQLGSQFGSQFGSHFRNEDFVPPVELIERDGEFVVRVELAGVREQDVEIRANEHVLTIRGERRERFDNEVARQVGAYEYSERRYGTFARTVTLPQGIDPSHIHAVFRDGVLELRIPQAETFRQRRIPIGRIDERPAVINDGQGLHQRPHVS